MENQIDILKQVWDKIPSIPKNQGTVLSEMDKRKIAETIVRAFHPGEFFYCIFNTKTAQIEFVDDNVSHILGIQKEDFQLNRIVKNIHPEDFNYFVYHEQCATEFFSQLPPEKLMSYKFCYDYRFNYNSIKYIRILQHTTPIQYFEDGGALTLVVFTDISHLKISGEPNISFIGLNGEPSFYNYKSFTKIKPSSHNLTRREKEILSYIINGHNSQDIASLLNLSVHTISTHRKNILKKSNCKSNIELISKALKEGWI